MTISELYRKLESLKNTFPNAPVLVQGWNDMGDLMDIELRGDIRIERNEVGNPVIVMR